MQKTTDTQEIQQSFHAHNSLSLLPVYKKNCVIGFEW